MNMDPKAKSSEIFSCSVCSEDRRSQAKVTLCKVSYLCTHKYFRAKNVPIFFCISLFLKFLISTHETI